MLFQVLGAVSGAMVANLMFEKPALVSGVVERISAGAFLGEVVASAGLLLIILLLVDQGKLNLIAVSVGCWIAAGHVFTSSTSFANPAVTLGRSLSDAASGIAATSVPGYVAAQLVGAAIAIFLASALKQRKAANTLIWIITMCDNALRRSCTLLIIFTQLLIHLIFLQNPWDTHCYADTGNSFCKMKMMLKLMKNDSPLISKV